MAFRVFLVGSDYGDDYPLSSELSELGCEFVDIGERPDAFYVWLNPDQLTDYGLARSLMWIGAFVASEAFAHNWVAMPPSYAESGFARALDRWKDLELVFNADAIDALATLFRKRFIGMPYPQYLQTPHWQRVREAALKAADYRCQVCNAGGTLHVHHRTYERRGRELPSDVIALCPTCHDLFHHRMQRDGE